MNQNQQEVDHLSQENLKTTNDDLQRLLEAKFEIVFADFRPGDIAFCLMPTGTDEQVLTLSKILSDHLRSVPELYDNKIVICQHDMDVQRMTHEQLVDLHDKLHQILGETDECSVE